MKTTILSLVLIGMYQPLWGANLSGADFAKYPSTMISNNTVKMQVYLPDPEKGLYRATRFDWSGAIGSLQYKGHEYFGYWSAKHDPLSPTGIMGPADTYKTAGMGYDEAKVGEGFIRIGVGSIEKADESNYDYHHDYKILDHGKWSVDQGKDWITFTHVIGNKPGYGYVYQKTLRLKQNGFVTEHRLRNTGSKNIETDQYSHNFFMIDYENAGPFLKVRYPYPVTTESDLKGLMDLRGNSLSFTDRYEKGSVFMTLKGYGNAVKDNTVTIENTKSGAGVTISVDQPLIKMEFWTNGTVLCPENSIQLFVKPGEEKIWNTDYTLFAK